MSPSDAAWRLLKSFGYADIPDDDDDEDFEEKFKAYMKEFLANRNEDEQYTSHVLDAGPHWTLDDRQKKVVEAALNVPLTHPNHHLGLSNYMREETHDMFNTFGYLFRDNVYQIPDHEYDRAVAIINNYAKEIDAHMSNPNADMSMDFLDNLDHPEHPWAKAVESYDGPLPIETDDWQTKNASEPMDLAWRLLKTRMSDDRERTNTISEHYLPRRTRKKPSGTLDKEKKERIDRLIEEERGMSLEEWRNKVLDDAYNRNFAFRSGGQSRLPGYIEHFATSSRQLGKPEIPKSALMSAIGDALRDVERNRIADAAPARPQPKTQPARLHMRVPHNRSRDFFLQDEEGNPLATIEGMKTFVTPRQPDLARNITGFAGSSQEQRKGHYRDLIESLLRHGFTLHSDSRNEMSNPFHRKFLRTLPDDIESPQENQDLIHRYDEIEYEAHAPFSRTKDLDYGDLVVETRSKYPMTYDTPYQGYKRRLDEGIQPERDIIVPTHIDREGNKIPEKRYLQSRLAGTGLEHDTFEITTPEGIIVPRSLRNASYYGPFMQTGGTTIPEFQPDSEVLSASQPSAQKIMGFGIDPVSRMRQQIGVVDTGLPRPGSNEFGEKQLRGQS